MSPQFYRRTGKACMWQGEEVTVGKRVKGHCIQYPLLSSSETCFPGKGPTTSKSKALWGWSPSAFPAGVVPFCAKCLNVAIPMERRWCSDLLETRRTHGRWDTGAPPPAEMNIQELCTKWSNIWQGCRILPPPLNAALMPEMLPCNLWVVSSSSFMQRRKLNLESHTMDDHANQLLKYTKENHCLFS